MTTPPTDAPGAPSGAGPLRAIVSGLGWNSLAQIVGVLVNLGLTPFLLEHLGLAPYGVVALVSSFRGLLSNLDGGLGPCATRYFAVFAGAKDRQRTSSLLLTMWIMTLLVVGVVAGIVALVAPALTVVVHAGPHLRQEAATLVRGFMPLLVFSALRLMLTRIVTAEHRWAYLNVSQSLGWLVYAGLAVALIELGQGVMAMLWAAVGMEAVAFVASWAGALPFLSLRGMRPMPWPEVRDLIRYASRVQIAEVASSFNIEIDALVVGLVLPVRFVGLYTIGSNFSTQLLNLPMNAVAPIGVALSRRFGEHGRQATIDEFGRLQRVWVRAVAAFALIGAASAVVAIPAWLGPQARPAGFVAAILLVGQAIQMLSRVMDALGKAADMPGLESAYLSVGMVINLALTIPLALTIGMLGVPIGTAVGQVVSTLYFLRIARRRLHPDLRSFFADVPKLAVAASVAATALLEIPASRLAPRGAAGLVCCALPATAGLALYAAMALDVPALRRSLSRDGMARLLGRRPGGLAEAPALEQATAAGSVSEAEA